MLFFRFHEIGGESTEIKLIVAKSCANLLILISKITHVFFTVFPPLDLHFTHDPTNFTHLHFQSRLLSLVSAT